MAYSLTDVQFRAIDPSHSVWLTAHAGTGKTKVLVDRIVRLLLSGESPSSILALTFTRAAAMEMQLRIREQLAAWSRMDNNALAVALHALLGREATADEYVRARRLLIEVMEHVPAMSIQTIHGFCQSLLSQFPLESGLGGKIHLLDEQTQTMFLNDASARVLQQATDPENKELANAIATLAGLMSDHTLKELIHTMAKEHATLFPLWHSVQAVEQYRVRLARGIELEADQTATQQLASLIARQPLQPELYDAWIAWLGSGNDQDKARSDVLQQLKDAPMRNECDISLWRRYAQSYVTNTGTLRKSLVSAALKKQRPEWESLLEREGEWALGMLDRLASLDVLAASDAASTIGQAMLALYEANKRLHGVVDYDDIILHASYLLSKPGVCEWILTRLDYRIQHVLVDEAQDTSPEQWQLLQSMIEELFQPDLYEHHPRTLFVVGDKKQSIYRFQGADPAGFLHYQQRYSDWFTQSGQQWENLTLNQSFRSTQPVLALVDAVCQLPSLASAFGEAEVMHHLFRREAGGLVELWPLIDKQSRPLPNGWSPPDTGNCVLSPAAQLIDQLVMQISGWISLRRILAGKNRSVTPGDILILVRRRNGFMLELNRALLRAGLPVAGSDRIALATHLAIKDLLVIADWCLHLSDDLALATILKGPLFQMSEEQLFALAHQRGNDTLWKRMQQSTDPAIVEATRTLTAIQCESVQRAPYEWLQYVLLQRGMQHKLRAMFGAEIDDVCQELCDQALIFEQQFVPDMQRFVSWIRASDSDIRRELEQGQNAIRIMTVHGAKGLQAPIVILPDTTGTPRHKEALWWKPVDGVPVAYVVPPNSHWPAVLQAVKTGDKYENEAEYWRLLYVALTRAEDELYVCGYASGTSSAQPNWYSMVREAMRQLPEMEIISTESGEQMRLSATSCVTRETSAIAELPEEASVSRPAWWGQCYKMSAGDALNAVIESPSSLDEDRFGHHSDLLTEILPDDARRRGNLVHQLLQLTSASPNSADIDEWQAMAHYLDPHCADIEMIVQETMKVRTHPDWAWIFDASAQAEMPVQGKITINGQMRLLRGQIDRVVIQEGSVHIIDFKTNRKPPQILADIPSGYLRQLEAYAALLRPLYPDYTIKCWLLWTATPSLMPVDCGLLD